MPIIIAYFYWYYLEKTREILHIIKDYIRYWAYFFSVKQTLKSLFSSWKMMDMHKGGNLITDIFENAFNNLISRVIGFMMRVFLLCFFVALEILTIVIGISIFVIWILMPVILVWIIIYSFTKINV